MMRNSRQAYGLIAIILHWLIALLVIGQLHADLFQRHRPRHDAGGPTRMTSETS